MGGPDEKKNDILEVLNVKGNKGAEEAAQLALKNTSVLKRIFEGVSSSKKRVKNAAGKTLRIISESAPEKVYSKFDFFVELMGEDDTILRWIGIDIVGNIARIDSEKRIDQSVLKKLYAFLHDESMITANHSIETLGKIGRHISRYRSGITTELSKVDSVERNEECRNIHVGQTILAFSEYVDFVRDRRSMIAFAERALGSSRNATRKKAERFLARFGNPTQK